MVIFYIFIFVVAMIGSLEVNDVDGENVNVFVVG